MTGYRMISAAFKGLERTDKVIKHAAAGRPGTVPVIGDSTPGTAKHRKATGVRNNIASISSD
jgi:hypothetical protein